MFKNIFYFPAKNLSIVVTLMIIVGLIVGSAIDTEFLRVLMPIAILAMIVPTMIGFHWKEMVSVTHYKVFIAAAIINFIIIPLLAYFLGFVMLKGDPELFAGLALASLLPTSGMTISWTMFYKGNVSAAIKITAISLIAGAIITPIYLTLMFDQIIDADLSFLFMKVMLVVFVPMIVGTFIHRWLMKKYSQEKFNKKVKPVLPAISTWGLMLIIFVMASINATIIFSESAIILQAILILVLFYLLNFAISTIVGKWLFNREDSIALVYSTVLRNLSIALGIAVTSFGPKAGLILALAFVIQIQAATWYGKLTDRFGVFKG
ncbi:arsenic resistance protein [Anaerobacillus sp. CMMVII]|uniref:arsenic resistance protein n=1 Tax=Anaerobacillus sp. CMMVII TaxID=2755588 RepID=UPI0021B82CDD|nr:bile acid:sodium symporter [Anaerobacillus sp. CMMVII]MCT8138396.1 arsenic resistance protein [Anaerobacillus sp. CMMVII]